MITGTLGKIEISEAKELTKGLQDGAADWRDAAPLSRFVWILQITDIAALCRFYKAEVESRAVDWESQEFSGSTVAVT